MWTNSKKRKVSQKMVTEDFAQLFFTARGTFNFVRLMRLMIEDLYNRTNITIETVASPTKEVIREPMRNKKTVVITCNNTPTQSLRVLKDSREQNNNLSDIAK